MREGARSGSGPPCRDTSARFSYVLGFARVTRGNGGITRVMRLMPNLAGTDRHEGPSCRVVFNARDEP